MSERKKILITGAAGRVGSALRKHLAERYDLRLLVHRTPPADLHPTDEVATGDVTDLDAMIAAARGVDVIAHLAVSVAQSNLSEAQRAQLTLAVDIPGVYNLLEAARVNQVGTFIFASTNHVTGLNEQDGICSRPDMDVRPDSIYGAGKAFGEALGRLYADRHGVRVFSLRIANFNGKDEPGRLYQPGYARWFSPRDLAQMVTRCIEAEGLRWGIFYGVSGGAEQKWDLTNARELLGYEPQDDGAAPEWGRKCEG